MQQPGIAENLMLAALHKLEAERAHDFTLWALRQPPLVRFMASRARKLPHHACLASEVFGLRFANPIGLAAGFDKNAVAVRPLLSLGFGFMEAGSITPAPQSGNPAPRLWRLPEQRGLRNHLGLNNRGAGHAEANLRRSGERNGILGISLAANTASSDPTDDYIEGIKRFAALPAAVDYVSLNISCPNISQGRRIQDSEDTLPRLLGSVHAARTRIRPGLPLLLKLAPDLDAARRQSIASLALDGLVDGLIISNTMPSAAGGISGRPLFAPSTQALRHMYRLTEGRVPLVGAGGVFSAEDAYAKIRAGASLVQLYTALVYEGPGLVGRILAGLASMLARDGYESITQAIGAEHVKHAEGVGIIRPHINRARCV